MQKGCSLFRRCFSLGRFSRERLRRVLRKKAAVVIHFHTLTFAGLHLHTLTSADLHLHTLTSADLYLHTFTSADLHLSHLHICRSTSSRPHICWSTSSHPHICRSILGTEPRTSRTLSENHATRPNSQLPRLCVRTMGTVTSNFSLSALNNGSSGFVSVYLLKKDPKRIFSRSECACRQAPLPL